MEKCMFCPESNRDLIEEHHTIPTSINPNWTKTLPVCVKCHKILHMYFLEDILDLVKKMKEFHMLQHNVLSENGILNYSLNETELHKALVNFLYQNIPKRFGNFKKTIRYKEILENIDFLEHDNQKNGQRLGYIVKDLRIDKRFNGHDGNMVVYTPRTISLLRRYKKS